MKYLFIIFSLFLFAACQQQEKAETSTVNAGNAISDTVNYTTIQWIDSVQEIGSLNYGQNPTINFRFRNTGDKPLFIVSAEPGCGCTVADYPKEAIMPGKEGVIKAGYDTKNQSIGAFHKSISVVTNTKGNVNHNLLFTGEIVKDGETKAEPVPATN